MNLRADQVAGGIFAAAGAAIFAFSGDLPMGSMGMPGAGMMPKLVIALMVGFALILIVRPLDGRGFAALDWSDLPHALRIVVVAAIAATLYTVLGFILTMVAMLFVLTFAIERRPLVPAAVFSIGVTLVAYVLFEKLLKSPLPHGLIEF
jgi:hypothetical protein